MSQSKFKKASLLAGTALVAAGVMTAGTASADGHAKVVNSGTDKTVMKISGHFSRQITYQDDGTERIRHSDSNFSSSRFLIDASGKINNDIKVGTRAEIAFDDARNVPAANNAEFDARSGSDLQTRKAEIHLTHSSMGKVWVGAGDTAANGITEMTFTNYTFLPGAINLQNDGAFRRPSANGSDIFTDVGATFSQSDMLGRSTRIRYDTPSIAGFKASVSHQDDQSYDAALRYSGTMTMFDTKVKAGIGFAVDEGARASTSDFAGAGTSHIGGSVAFQHSSGIGATYTFEYMDPKVESSVNHADPFFQNAQLHYTTKFNEMGRSQFVYEYNHHENKRTENETATAHSVGFHQNIDAAAMEVAVRYSHLQLDTDAAALDNDDVDAVSLHLRVKF